MRIYGPNATRPATRTGTTQRSSGTGFSISEDTNAVPASPVRLAAGVGGIDALVALQGTPDPAERRRRAVRQGRGALDALDALKLGLLGGRLDAAALRRLQASAAELSMSSGDPGLDDVLVQIELRAAVELAKFSAPRDLAKDR
jgi:hypothetical protein